MDWCFLFGVFFLLAVLLFFQLGHHHGRVEEVIKVWDVVVLGDVDAECGS